MNQNNQLSFAFKTISGKHVTADFTGGDVTSCGGLLILRELADRMGMLTVSRR